MAQTARTDRPSHHRPARPGGSRCRHLHARQPARAGLHDRTHPAARRRRPVHARRRLRPARHERAGRLVLVHVVDPDAQSRHRVPRHACRSAARPSSTSAPASPSIWQEASSVVLIGPGASMAEHDLASIWWMRCATTERVQSRLRARVARRARARATRQRRRSTASIRAASAACSSSCRIGRLGRRTGGAPRRVAAEGSSLHRDFLTHRRQQQRWPRDCSTPTISAAPSPASSARTAPTTCWATDRRATPATVACAGSTCGSTGPASPRARATPTTIRARGPRRSRPIRRCVLTNALSGILPQPDLALAGERWRRSRSPAEKTMGVAIVLGVRQPVPRGDSARGCSRPSNC